MPGHSEPRPAPARTTVVALTVALVAVSYLDRVCISTAAPAMRRDIGLSDGQMGILFGVFTLTYALFEIPSGIYADHFGAKKTLMRIVVFWSAMTALTGFMSSLTGLFLARLLFGVGEAGAYPAIARLYRLWLPPSARGAAFGVLIMAGPLSGALTQPLVMGLLSWISWRQVFWLFACVGLVWAIVFQLVYQEPPAEKLRESRSAPLQPSPAPPARSVPEPPVPLSALPLPAPPSPLQLMIRSRSLWLLCAMYFGAIYGWYCYLTWFPTYLLRARSVDMRQLGFMSSLPLVGIALGVLLGGLLADSLPRRWGKRWGARAPGLVGLPIAAAGVWAAALVADSRLCVVLFSISACGAALGVAPAWTTCAELGGTRSAMVSGAMNMFGNLGGGISSIVVGHFLEQQGGWEASLFTLTGMYGLAAACWLGIDSSHPLFPAASFDAVDDFRSPSVARRAPLGPRRGGV